MIAKFRYFLVLGIWGVGLALGGSVLVVLMFLTRRNWFTPPTARWVIITGFRAAGVRFKIEGLEHLQKNQTYLYLANHQSMLDIPALYNFLPGTLGFLAKIELKRIPVLGQGFTQMGMVWVDRRNRDRALRSTEKVKQRLREGMSFIVFPEGTRSPDGRMLPFKKGAFHIALDVKAKIVPVTITNAYQIMPKRGRCLYPGVVHTIVHPPLDAADFPDVQTLKARVEEIVASGLAPELRKQSSLNLTTSQS